MNDDELQGKLESVFRTLHLFAGAGFLAWGTNWQTALGVFLMLVWLASVLRDLR